MTFDILLWEKTSCSYKEKQELIPVIDTMVKLAEKSRREGLLSIEDDIDSIDSLFIKKGLQLVVDGTDPEMVRSLLVTLIHAGGYSGVELLRRMIASDGILCIQSGERPEFIRTKLYSYLGEDFESLPVREPADKIPYTDNDTIESHEFSVNVSEPVKDEACMAELTDILNANGHLVSMEPVSAEEIKLLSGAISSSNYGVKTFINIIGKQPSVISQRLLTGFKEYSYDIYCKIMEEWINFHDLAMCDDPAIQKILREIDTRDIVKALKGADSLIQDKIFSNMSNRASALVKEDVKYMGPVVIEDIEDSRNKIINVARKLQEAGEIIIPVHGERLLK